MNIRSLSRIFVFILFVIFLTPCFGQASIMLFDDKLRVKGSLYEFIIYRTDLKREERQYRDTDLGLLRTKANLELLYKAVEKPNLEVNIFGFFHYWHDSLPDIDDEYRHSISTRDHKRYQGPFFDQDDWVNELYVDMYAGKWNLRLGKQIVVWSEVAMVRTVDMINPLDLRYSNPGIDPWDEIKLGLWMMRGFYNSTLPGQLVFEWIWIPGDFEQIRTGMEGTSNGNGIVSPQGPEDRRPRAYGMKSLADRIMHRARPAFNLRNSQFALRIRGNSEIKLFNEYYLLDWTVSWFHGMRSTPVARTRTLGAPSATNLDPSTFNGLMGSHAVSRVFGGSFPDFPSDSFMKYKFFDAIGASCQSYIPWLEGVIRGEVTYEIGVPINTTLPKHIDDSGNFYTGNSERDQINFGLTLDRPCVIPWMQDRGWDAFDISLGWAFQRKSGNVSRRWETFGWRDRTQSNFLLNIKSRFYHSELRPVIAMKYNTRNWGYCGFVLAYLPSKHMRYTAGFMWMFAGDPTDSGEASAENGDFLFVKIGYEF